MDMIQNIELDPRERRHSHAGISVPSNRNPPAQRSAVLRSLLVSEACDPMKAAPIERPALKLRADVLALSARRPRGDPYRAGAATHRRGPGVPFRRVPGADAGVRHRQGRQGRARVDRRRLRGGAGRPARRGRLVPLRRHHRRGRAGRAARRLGRAPALPAAVRQVVHQPAGPRPLAPRRGRLRAGAAWRRPTSRPWRPSTSTTASAWSRTSPRTVRCSATRSRRSAFPACRRSPTRSGSRPTSRSPTCRRPRRCRKPRCPQELVDSFARAQLIRMRSADEQTYLHNVGTLLEGLDGLAAALRGVEGRKQILYFSAGFDSRVLVGNWGSDQRTPGRGGDPRPALGGGQHGALRRQPAARDARHHHPQPGRSGHGGALDRRHGPRRRQLAHADRRQPGPRPRHHQPRVARHLRARHRRAALRQRERPRPGARRDARDDEPLLRARDPARSREGAGLLPQAEGQGRAQGRQALAPARLLRARGGGRRAVAAAAAVRPRRAGHDRRRPQRRALHQPVPAVSLAGREAEARPGDPGAARVAGVGLGRAAGGRGLRLRGRRGRQRARPPGPEPAARPGARRPAGPGARPLASSGPSRCRPAATPSA